MKPHLHANLSAKKFGGDPADYYDIHEFIDSSKISVGDVRHRAMLHSTWGVYLVAKVFGDVRVNSAGKQYSVRDVAEEHIIQDLGFLPTMERWLNCMTIEPWMSGTRKRAAAHKTRTIYSTQEEAPYVD
jgi:hypothetical protein